MSSLDLIIDLHRGSQRQGPGSAEETLKALEFTGLSDNRSVKVADIGCGTGGQTITLAQTVQGHITAVDLFPEFLTELQDKIDLLGLQDKVTTLKCSMDNLPFQKEEFDMIWSEGAIYNMGFENGVRNWRKFIKPGGYLAVSEITWFDPDPPTELKSFWQGEYPEMASDEKNISILEENGYSLAGYFELDPKSWTKNYYEPLIKRFDAFLDRHGYSEEARSLIDEHKAEIDLYGQYGAYYGYGFYVARKEG